MRSFALVVVLLSMLLCSCSVEPVERPALPTATADPLFDTEEVGITFLEGVEKIGAAARFRYRTNDGVVIEGGFDFIVDAHDIRLTNISYGEFSCREGYGWEQFSKDGDAYVRLIKK